MIPIQVVIDTPPDFATPVRNVWDFSYDLENRTVYLCAFRKYAKIEGTWHGVERVMPRLGLTEEQAEECLEEALGPEYDKHKVIAIALAKCLEADFFMRYNEMNFCIAVRFWRPELNHENSSS